MDDGGAGRGVPRLRPWYFVLVFGLVSLFADMVYEGERSVIGPFLATLGASATVVGVTAGAGEFIGYGLRVVSGYVVGRSQHYWTWTISGYVLTVLSVPLLGATHSVAPALLLYGSERLGKAVRSPAKDTLLSHASTRTGRGAAFGVHQALDQAGAMAGPLLLAAVLAGNGGNYRMAFAVLAVPGVVVIGLLVWLRHRVPDPVAYEAQVAAPPTSAAEVAPRVRLPPLFWRYAFTVGILSSGLASFPLLSYHAQTSHLLSAAQVPVLFAVAMFVDGLSGLAMGRWYDVVGPRVLLAVPVAAAIAAIAFSRSVLWIWIGVGVWGIVHGVLDSTVKAVVTELVPIRSRAAAFGWLALMRGLGLLVAGAVLGVVYDHAYAAIGWLIVAVNAVALIGLASLLRRLVPQV